MLIKKKRTFQVLVPRFEISTISVIITERIAKRKILSNETTKMTIKTPSKAFRNKMITQQYAYHNLATNHLKTIRTKKNHIKAYATTSVSSNEWNPYPSLIYNLRN